MSPGLFQFRYHHLRYKIRRRRKINFKSPNTKSNGVGKESVPTGVKLLDQFLLIATFTFCLLLPLCIQPAHAAPRPEVNWPSIDRGKMTERSYNSETASHFNHLQTSHPFLQKTQITKEHYGYVFRWSRYGVSMGVIPKFQNASLWRHFNPAHVTVK